MVGFRLRDVVIVQSSIVEPFCLSYLIAQGLNSPRLDDVCFFVAELHTVIDTILRVREKAGGGKDCVCAEDLLESMVFALSCSSEGVKIDKTETTRTSRTTTVRN